MPLFSKIQTQSLMIDFTLLILRHLEIIFELWNIFTPYSRMHYCFLEWNHTYTHTRTHTHMSTHIQTKCVYSASTVVVLRVLQCSRTAQMSVGRFVMRCPNISVVHLRWAPATGHTKAYAVPKHSWNARKHWLKTWGNICLQLYGSGQAVIEIFRMKSLSKRHNLDSDFTFNWL